jgi:hypothetical protein
MPISALLHRRAKTIPKGVPLTKIYQDEISNISIVLNLILP